MRGRITTKGGKVFELPDNPSPEELRDIFRPYGVELGYVAFSWNRLHDQLAQIFAVLFTPTNERKSASNSPFYRMAMAVWQSSNIDYSQREMLRRAINAPSAVLSQGQIEAIETVLNEIDNSLRHKRNSALHAPLMFTTAVIDDAVRTYVEPNVWTPNTNAKMLRNSVAKRNGPNQTFDPSDLVEELKWYGAIADALSSYVAEIGLTFDDPEHALPGKLKLPRPGHRPPGTKAWPRGAR